MGSRTGGSQPGLETAEYAGLEVVPNENLPSRDQTPYLDTRDQDGMHVYKPYYESIPSSGPSELSKDAYYVQAIEKGGKKPWKRKRWLLLGGLVLLLVVAGSVVGGILGSRSQSTAPAPTTTPSTTPTAQALKSIRPNSPLTVTGWRKRNGVEINLFYQDPDSQIRSSKYDSGRGQQTVNNSYWENPSTLVSESTDSQALAVVMILFSNVYAPMRIIYYLNKSSRLLGVDDNPSSNPATGDDSIRNATLTVPLTNRLSGYWPYIFFQDSSGELKEIRNNLLETNKYSPMSVWTTRGLGVLALDGSHIAAVPLSVNFTTIAERGGYGVAYQTTSGTLAILVPDADNSATSNQTHSWPAGVAFPSISMPNGAAIAAFSTARPNDSSGRVNTYILYQSDDNSIRMVWLDNETTWSMSAPKALAVADNGTDIACLTMPTSENDYTGTRLLLEKASSETRCYFQRGGVVREFVLSGTDWVELGNVPIS